jgi:hypothetical protein
MTEDSKPTCSHEGCVCEVNAAQAKSSAAEQYCSDGCAKGAGCTHADCNCAAYDAPIRGH